MHSAIFTELSLAFVIAAGVSLVMRMFRQPLIIGYILSGIIIGPSFLGIIQSHAAFESFSQIGIALLLFVVGLGLNVAIIKNTGKPVLFGFFAVTIGLGGLGVAASHLLGFTPHEMGVAAAALCFSSTIIVIKSLTDKKEQGRLYAQISIGILLVEDILATVALIVVAASSGSGTDGSDFLVLASKGLWFAGGLSLVGAFVMPRLSRLFAASQEFLFVFSLAWAFGVAGLAAKLGFSVEVGALFAGVALATLPYATEMASRLKPLRDFFLVLFFITLGEQLQLSNFGSAIVPALVFSFLIMVAKPALIMGALGVLGYTKQTGFKSAVHLTQLSEFSIILAVLATTSGLIQGDLVDVMTLTAIITIAVSTYLMKYDDALYRRFAKPLSFFERRNATIDGDKRSGVSYHYVLFGYHKGGHEFVKTFRDMRGRYVVVDYDPSVIETLERQHIHHIYGDATDAELLEEIGLQKAELIVSTIGDYTANKIILAHVLKQNPHAIFICHSNTFDQAALLYKHGASYVILPHYIGSMHMTQFIRHNGSNKKAFERYRRQHVVTLGNAALR